MEAKSLDVSPHPSTALSWRIRGHVRIYPPASRCDHIELCIIPFALLRFMHTVSTVMETFSCLVPTRLNFARGNLLWHSLHFQLQMQGPYLGEVNVEMYCLKALIKRPIGLDRPFEHDDS